MTDPFLYSDKLNAKDRLLWLSVANREIELRKSNMSRVAEEFDAELMFHPVRREKAYRIFGAAIGFIPTAAIFTLIVSDISKFGPNGTVFLLLGILSTVVTSLVGYCLGKTAGSAIAKLEQEPIPVYLFLVVLVGAAWGALAGIAGGSVIFLIGSVFGGLFGAAIGAVGVPIFSILFRLLSKADTIERKHLVPLVLGISLVFAAFILGLSARA
jgi:hypothetical protein